MKIGVLLSGAGVYDGAEIHEAVLTLLEIESLGYEAVCIGVDAPQHHVVNHLTGQEQAQTRNMLEEAARIARGQIREISTVVPADLDALVIPGGFGSAKNFSSWAFEGPNAQIRPDVKLLLVNMYNVGKPIVALCVSPVLLALAFEDMAIGQQLTIGSTNAPSPYHISDFQEGLQTKGAQTPDCTIQEICIDLPNRIITAPCYMLEASLPALQQNIRQALAALKQLLES
ncbi:MAG: isoprenoid biosynthesis glyoxalase ElbB [Crocinitomicaceae bacterium]|nr:isoprenoid biosynthesis glyoxalase ElbB [Crocinitomicaceae bacterium]MDP4739144.1 isoprenoid biosynthesis glyoxalase ElbB [Crocinitomicaceae bacterium]MDP4807281.1 isoprenoid biosynthesis glyoxalase ElbB [Crocinitomicaceae bacterium]MDP4867589.1 isoprenoid biosynthesis glyoxalase ElbB [Crocinitomicaceae bacterium]MDP4955547.1 isoprenoid biosynthesis glyoxalase ElbB [Crocinitomicaceae bacterium]